MTIQNPLYGRELSEGEAAIAYQPKSPILTTLSNPPSNGAYLLSISAGTLTWAAPSTDLVPEGSSKLYFTTARAKAAITGAASTVVSTDLTPSRVAVSDPSGKLSASTVSVGELGYLSGVTSNIQGQLASINSALGSIGDIGNLTTSTVAEGSNLYYTDTRVRAALTGAVSPVLTANLTASRLLVSDTGGKVSTSNVTSVEAGYLSGVTSPIQAQLAQVGTLSTTVANLTTTSVPEGNRLYFTSARATASITGAASTVTTVDLPLSRALISDSTGKLATSPVTTTELSYLGGVTSSLQGQIGTINTTVAGLTTTTIAEGTNLYHTPGRVVLCLMGAVATIATADLTVSRVLVSTASGKVGASTVTTTEVGYLAGSTSNLQAQVNTLSTNINTLSTTNVVEGTNQYFTSARVVASITGAASLITTNNLTVSKALISDASGKVSVSSVTSTELGYLSGVTSGLQAQLGTISTTISSLTTSSVAEGTTNLYFTTQRAVAAITGAASSIATTNLAVSKVLVSDASGKVSTASTTTVEVGYVCGVTSPIQAQLNTIIGRTITAGNGLSGGGILSGNVSLAIAFEATPSILKAAGTASVGTANTVPRADHVHPPDTTKVDVSLMGAAGGVATLDSNVKVPTSQIPTITTQVGFGGESVSVPYTGSTITLPLPVAQGGTGTTTTTSALSSLGGQPISTVLTGIAGTASSGFLVKDAAGVAQVRSLQVNNPLTITNPSGLSDNPIISLSQGDGSGLDADLLDGAHGSAYFKVDGTVTYSTGTATTIRGSISAAFSGVNTDITSMSAVAGIGNTSNTHITITTTGSVGMGETSPANYGKVAIRGGSAGTNTSSLAVMTPNGNNLRADVALWSTFTNYPADITARRTADIVAGFSTGVWGTEYLSLNVGGANAGAVCTERVRIDGSGNLLVGTSTTITNGGDVQVSKGITFPSSAVPCSNVNTLDDYKEGTWTPVIDSSTPGTGRVTTVYYAGFTKVGNLVTFTAFALLSTLGTGGSGNLVINGLPYTSASGSGQAHYGLSVPYFSGLKTAIVGIGATVQPNSTQVLFRGWPSAVTSVPSLDFGVYLQAGASFIISGFYFI